MSGPSDTARRGSLHPMLVVLAMLLITVFLTHFIPAGKFERVDSRVVAGTYQALPKINGISALLAAKPPTGAETPARAMGFVGLFSAVPTGMSRSANLIFMVMFVGGCFGILRKTGVIDAGIERLLHLTSGNVYLLTAGLMFVLSCGSTFLGFSSEYIALIPVVLALGKRLGLPNLFAPMIVALSDFIGYTASVTNPIALGVAQPLAGVPMFSGLLPRMGVFIVLFTLGLSYVMWFLRKLPKAVCPVPEEATLTTRQIAVIVGLILGGAILVLGTSVWSWHIPELGSAFLAFALFLSILGGLRASEAADAFLDGMKGMLLATTLMGFATSAAVLLEWSQVLDSIVQGIGVAVSGHSRGLVASGLMAGEMAFGVLLTGVSGKAAISMPILAPIAQLSGVSGQTTVSALLFGSGMTNMISPTNSLLLAFLAAARVGYLEWARFIWPLFITFCAICFTVVYFMAVI